MNKVLHYLKVKNLDNVKDLVQAGARLAYERPGVTAKRKGQRESFLKRPIKGDIAKVQKDLSQIDEWVKDKWKNGNKRREKMT